MVDPNRAFLDKNRCPDAQHTEIIHFGSDHRVYFDCPACDYEAMFVFRNGEMLNTARLSCPNTDCTGTTLNFQIIQEV